MDELLLEWTNAQFQSARATLSAPGITQDSRQKAIDSIADLMDKIRFFLFSWEARSEAARLSVLEKMSQQWESMFGDLEDPVTKQAIEETSKFLRDGMVKKEL